MKNCPASINIQALYATSVEVCPILITFSLIIPTMNASNLTLGAQNNNRVQESAVLARWESIAIGGLLLLLLDHYREVCAHAWKWDRDESR